MFQSLFYDVYSLAQVSCSLVVWAPPCLSGCSWVRHPSVNQNLFYTEVIKTDWELLCFFCVFCDNFQNYRVFIGLFLIAIKRTDTWIYIYAMRQQTEIGQFDKLTWVFHASVLLLIMNFVGPQVLWQYYDEIHDQQQKRRMKNWRHFVKWKQEKTFGRTKNAMGTRADNFI